MRKIKREVMLPEFGDPATPDRLDAQEKVLSANIKFHLMRDPAVVQYQTKIDGQDWVITLRKTSHEADVASVRNLLFSALVSGLSPGDLKPEW